MPRRRSATALTPSEPTSTFHPDPYNANRGTDRGRTLLETSLREYGAGRSVLADREGILIAGNKTYEAAQRLGIPVRVVESDGRELVVVRRRDLLLRSDPRARALGVADNRTSEVGLEWDPAILAALKADGVRLEAFWTDEEFAALLGHDLEGSAKDDALVVEPGPTSLVRGDLVELGPHRLLCGDATDAGDVARVLGNQQPAVLITDPPYGVDYDPAWRHRVNPQQRSAVGRVANDTRVDWSAAFRLFTGNVAYVWHAGAQAPTAGAALQAAGFTLRSQIIWVKQTFVLSRGDYHWRHEPCYYAVRTGRRSGWRGDRRQSTVWEVPNLNPHGGTRDGDNAVSGHGTQKPVRLWEIPILNHTVAGDTVFDPFCGSGTALIAAQKTERRCCGIEIDPRYVQAALTRWEQYTGERARVSHVSRPRKAR